MAIVNVLAVDDDLSDGQLVRSVLASQGYSVLTAATGAEALSALAGPPPDLILLDLRLPDTDGLEVCRRTRELSTLPVIVVSGIGDESRKVEALDSGADDYLTKPLGAEELLARIRGVMRRSQLEQPDGLAPAYVAGDLRLDFARRRVTVADQEVSLTPTGYSLLSRPAVFPGQAQTHQALLQDARGLAYVDESECLHVSVSRIRRKIEPNPAKPFYLLAVPGVGYKMREP